MNLQVISQEATISESTDYEQEWKQSFNVLDQVKPVLT